MKNKIIGCLYLLIIVMILIFTGIYTESYQGTYTSKIDVLSPETLNKVQNYKEIKVVKSFKDVAKYKDTHNVFVEAFMTNYGPDCVGCGGNLACNGKNVQNGKIYYEDHTYGKMRIIASDPSIPCGTIFNIYDNGSEYRAISLDRGGAIRGNKFDLLNNNEAEAERNGVKNLRVSLVRWGY